MPSSIDVIVSASADRNLQQILTYTEKQWGTGQRDAYRQVLLDAFLHLGAHPDIGHPIEGRPSDIREYIVRSHVIRLSSRTRSNRHPSHCESATTEAVASVA